MNVNPWWQTRVDHVYWPMIELALKVGQIQAEAFRSAHLHIDTKSSGVDLVTEVDLASDKEIRQTITALFPQDSLLTEESGMALNSSKRLWIVDPLDGTTNYASGLPIFAVSIALWVDQKPEFGVVYLPILGELCVGQSGRGAFLNDMQCRISQKMQLNTCVFATGFPYDRATAQNNNSQNMTYMIPKVRGIRRMGAAAYDLTLVAAGVLDGFWELRLSLWDLAAAKLFLLEAGATIYEQVENNQYSLLVGNEHLVNHLKPHIDLSSKKDPRA